MFGDEEWNVCDKNLMHFLESIMGFVPNLWKSILTTRNYYIRRAEKEEKLENNRGDRVAVLTPFSFFSSLFDESLSRLKLMDETGNRSGGGEWNERNWENLCVDKGYRCTESVNARDKSVEVSGETKVENKSTGCVSFEFGFLSFFISIIQAKLRGIIEEQNIKNLSSSRLSFKFEYI